MAASEANRILIFRNLFTGESILNEIPNENWFLPPCPISKCVKTPLAIHYTNGFNLKETRVHSILASINEKDIKETDADAILAEFWLSPGEKTLKKIMAATNKPVIVTLNRRIRKITKIVDEAKKFEILGAKAILTGNLITCFLLDKIRNAISLPIISKSEANAEGMISRHQAGANIICISGMEVSHSLIDAVKKSFPLLPIITYAENSEEIILNSLASGINAIIFKPWGHVDSFT